MTDWTWIILYLVVGFILAIVFRAIEIRDNPHFDAALWFAENTAMLLILIFAWPVALAIIIISFVINSLAQIIVKIIWKDYDA